MPPAALPADDAFEPTSESLASAYESSWLACRLIAQTYGEEQLVAFYQAVAAAGTEPAVATESAFQTVLGTTSAEFVAAWQVALAGTRGMNVDTSRAAAAIVLVVLVYALIVGVATSSPGVVVPDGLRADRHGSGTSPRTSGSVRSGTTVRFARRRTREWRSAW